MAGKQSSAPSGAVFLDIPGVGFWTTSVGIDLGLLTAREQTDLLKHAVTVACDWYIQTFMPKRFTSEYAYFQLGYQISSKTRKKKDKRAARYPEAADPNTWTGETKKQIMESRTDVRGIGGATKGFVGATIRYSYPGYVDMQQSVFGGSMTAKTIRKITQYEGGQLAARVFKEMADAVSRIRLERRVTRGGELKIRGALDDVDRMGMYFSSRANAPTIARKSVAVG